VQHRVIASLASNFAGGGLFNTEQILNAIGFGTIQDFFGIINKIDLLRIKGVQSIQTLPEFYKFLGMSNAFRADNDIEIIFEIQMIQFEGESCTVGIGGKPDRIAIIFKIIEYQFRV